MLVAIPRLVFFSRAVRLFLVGVCLSISLLAQEDRLYELYEGAQRAQQSGDYRSAANDYEEIVRLRPDLAEAFANLGSVYYQMGDEKKASAALKKAIELKPQLAGPHFFLGVLSVKARRHEEAVRFLKTAGRSDPSNLIVQLYLGFAHYALGDYPAAVTSFEKAANLRDHRADAYYHLSKAYAHLSKKAFSRLQTSYPGSFFAHLASAHFYEAKQSWEDAKKAYAAALDKRPDNPGLRARLKWVGQNAEGSLSTPPASTFEGDSAGSLVLLYKAPPAGQINSQLSEYQGRTRKVDTLSVPDDEKLYIRAELYQALSYLTTLWISENDPGSYRAHQLQAQLHEAQGKSDEAIEEYRQALKLKPDLQNVHFSIGSLYWASDRMAEALPELQRELEINPNHPEAHYEIADILYSQRKLPEAKKHLLECLRLEPEMPEAHLAIERIYSADGDFDKALEHMRILTKISPQDPTPHYRMSIIYRKLGDQDRVKAELKTFEELRRQQRAR